MKHSEQKTKRIAELNDMLRQTFWGGQLLMTQGVQQLPDDVTDHIFNAVMNFDNFTEANDPYCEHDFGRLKVRGYTIIWKIDYYDLGMEYASPDPADPDVTCRALTIMLAEEY